MKNALQRVLKQKRFTEAATSVYHSLLYYCVDFGIIVYENL